ncbi:MAG: hypothetical protein CM1200mP2_43270 [Planctomycetaceae bacterium]|nr:MAG: hypothetical protein CM1200mP2_43270 [Planctomycetaceae bacterium]
MAGQIYYDGCRHLLETFRQVEKQVFAINDRVTGRLRVAAIYSVGLIEMAESVSEYRAHTRMSRFRWITCIPTRYPSES